MNLKKIYIEIQDNHKNIERIEMFRKEILRADKANINNTIQNFLNF